jgi:hypothetical protein
MIEMDASSQLQSKRSALEAGGGLMSTKAQSVIFVKSVVFLIVFSRSKPRMGNAARWMTTDKND